MSFFIVEKEEDEEEQNLQSQQRPPALNCPLKWSIKFTPPPLHWEHATAPFTQHILHKIFVKFIKEFSRRN